MSKGIKLWLTLSDISIKSKQFAIKLNMSRVLFFTNMKSECDRKKCTSVLKTKIIQRKNVMDILCMENTQNE